MNTRDSVGNYLTSLRNERKICDKIDQGVPFFVPQLSKVKTSAMCTKTQTHLLFGYEKLIQQGESYRKQGDKTLYTEEKLVERQNLQQDGQIQAALGRFWDTFGSIRMGKYQIDELEYCDVFVKFFKALVPPQEFSVPEARIIVEKDWARDVGEDATMSKAMFFKSLFEVADLWTVGIGVDEYTKFLTKLFDRVTMTVFDQEKALWLTKFAELDMIKSSWMEENQVVTPTESKIPSPKRVNAVAALAKLKKKSHTVAVFKPSELSESSKLETTPNNNLPGLVSPEKPPRRPVRIRQQQERRISTSDSKESSNGVEETKQIPSEPSSPIKALSPKKQKGADNQDMRVAMPSIYLTPDLEVQKEDDIAVKRRLRENTKLVQRLRRTTY